jgi:hypothetical protein
MLSPTPAEWPQPTIGQTDPDSPEWAVLGFLRGWQRRDWPAMALSLTSGRAAAEALAAQYDFRPLRGAEIVSVERLDPSTARVRARVWYEFPPGRVQPKQLELMVLRTEAPRTAATGPGTWKIHPASAAKESEA